MKKLLALFMLIACTLTAQTRPHWLDLKYPPHTIKSVKQFGAVGDGVTNDTLAIQTAINSGESLHFPNGAYLVDNINFNQAGTSYYFNNATIVASATSPDASVIQITNRYITFNGLKINGNKRPGDTAAIHWHSPSAGQPAQWVTINDLYITNCNIGILFGQLSGTPVVDAPQSESVVNGYITRGVRIPVYLNQSNGFLHLNTPILDCQSFEYSVADGAYTATQSFSIFNIGSTLHVNGGELLKTAEQAGHCIWNTGSSYLTNVTIESAATIASSSGFLQINTSSGGYFSNDSSPLFVLSGLTFLQNLAFYRPEGAMAYSSARAIHCIGTPTITIKDSIISGWSPDTFMGASNANPSCQGDVTLQCVKFPSASDANLSNEGHNLLSPEVEYVATASIFTPHTPGVSSHTIVDTSDHPGGYASASRLVGASGQTSGIYVQNTHISQTQGLVLEYWIRHVSGPFYGVSYVIYRSADGVTQVGPALSIAAPDKSEGPITAGSTSDSGWKKMNVVIPPRAGAAYVFIALEQEQDCVVERTGFVLK